MMAQGMTKSAAPRGLARLAFRLPIWLYRLHLGWLLGGRLLLLTHIGRKSGLPRQAVIEVVRHDRATDTYIIASGFGAQVDWLRNIQKHPNVVVQTGRQRLEVVAKRCRSMWRRMSCTAMLSGTHARFAYSRSGCSARIWMAAPSRVAGWRPMYPWSRSTHVVEPMRCIDGCSQTRSHASRGTTDDGVLRLEEY